MSSFVQIVLPIPLNRTFLYSYPDELKASIQIGARALVPFGKRKLTGVIVGIDKKRPPEDLKVKEIIEILDHNPVFSEEHLTFTRLLSEYHYSSWGELLTGSSPSIFSPKSRMILSLAKDAAGRLEEENLSEKEKKLLSFLQRKNYTLGYLKRQIGEAGFSGLVSRLEKRNLIEVSSVIDKPARRTSPQKTHSPKQLEMGFLPEELWKPAKSIVSAIKKGKFAPYLLYGPLEKREAISVHLIKSSLEEKKTVLFLVPEISLTDRFVDKIQNNFGDRAVVFHSRLSEKKREEAWKTISAGAARVVIGTRSALFLPLKNVGLIILDGEQDDAFYQTENPVFDARKGAWIRAEVSSSVLIYGSEFPSIELYHKARKNGFLVDLPRERRVQNVAIIEGSSSDPVISFQVQKKIARNLAKKEPVLIFLNRRGYASYTLCSKCGRLFKCPKCQIPLIYHKSDRKLSCHYCNFSVSLPIRCQDCGNDSIQKRGIGVEILQEELSKIFPEARIERFDSDTVKNEQEKNKILTRLDKGEIDLLIGTQYLVRQKDFSPLSLVVAVYPETLLALPYFQAKQKAFQTLDALFRCLHNRKESELVIQTAMPEQFAWFEAKKGDYETFYKEELTFRQLMGYPPFSCLIEVQLASDSLRILARECRNLIAALKLSSQKGEIMGPALAPLTKIRGKHRAQVIIKLKKREPSYQKELGTVLDQLKTAKKVFIFE